MKRLCKKMKKRAALFLACLMAFSLSACAGEEEGTSGTAPVERAEQQPETESDEERSGGTQEDGKILVVYFSATGTTKEVAERLAGAAGADLEEIVPAQPYTDEDLDYNDDSCRANREQNDENVRPQIDGSIDNMDEYDMVLIGHPIWWSMEPRIMDTFMESYDFSGKILANFCTSGGSGIAQSSENLEALSPDAVWLEGRRFSSGADDDEIRQWLDDLGIARP